MKTDWITCEAIYDGQRLLRDASIRLMDGHVAEISQQPAPGPRLAGCLTPGFVDLQVNGGGGHLLNNAPTAAAIAQIAAAHRRLGTVGILPTVITDTPDVLQQAARAAVEARGQDGVLGLHIEGPHIALARRGTHKAAFIRPFSADTFALIQMLRAADMTVMITVAPEMISADQISEISRLGVIVALGHTDATADQIAKAVAAGASCGTHLFNAMSPMTSRAPGAVGGILDAGIQFGIICDGHHVDDRMVRLALRASAGHQRGFLVSDAMATVGGPDSFTLYGETIRLKGGRLINPEGNLAGAHVTQAEGVARLVNRVGLDLCAALEMAVTIPARVIDRPDLATLVGRKLSDVLVLSNAGHLVTDLADFVENSGDFPD